MERKLYKDWEPILEEEQDCKVYDPDGRRMVIADGKDEIPMTKQEALDYFWHNTMRFGPMWSEKFKQVMAEGEQTKYGIQ